MTPTPTGRAAPTSLMPSVPGAPPGRSSELADAVDDVGDLLLGELGVHRQREDLSGGAVGVWVAAADAQPGVGRLPVERDRIVDGGADPALHEVGEQLVSVRGADHVQVVDVADIGRLDR